MSVSVEAVISNVVRERLSNATITAVEVEEDEDSDGDPILRVIVVLDTAISEIEPARITGLIRHLRANLSRQDEHRFPMVSFMSKRDRDKLARDAA